MLSHLDDNAGWVLMVFAITLGALAIATALAFINTQRRKKHLERIELPKN